MQAAFFLGLAFILGACVGSFINCMAFRMVYGGSVLKGRSRCPQCDHTLGVLDLIPIVSWLLLRGRCRYCKAQVSPRYFLVEVCMALLFAALVWQFGIGIQTATYMILLGILLGLSLVDLETLIIPNGFIIAGLAIWLVSVWFMQVPPWGFTVGSMFTLYFGFGFLPVFIDGLIGAVVIGGGILLLSLVFDRITGRRSLGGGDIKLLFMVGLYLGLFGGLFNLLLSCIVGLLFSVLWRALGSEGAVDSPRGKRAQGQPKPFPFGPSIAAATVLTLFFGSTCLSWYFGLFL